MPWAPRLPTEWGSPAPSQGTLAFLRGKPAPLKGHPTRVPVFWDQGQPMKPLWILVLLLFLTWLLSIFLLWPLPLVVALFAALVSLSSMTIWLALMERRARRT